MGRNTKGKGVKMVKEITLDISGKDIKLSLEDAKKLYKELSEIFQEEETKKHVAYRVSFPDNLFTTWGRF